MSVPTRPNSPIPSLSALCLNHLADQLSSSPAFLDHLDFRYFPPHLIEQLFYLCFIRSSLNPTNIRLFLQSGHEGVITWIEKNMDVSRALFPMQGACNEKKSL